MCPLAVMLYLNDKTFVGELGQDLAEEVTLAQDNGIEVVLAHESDPDCGGCPFGRHAPHLNSLLVAFSI